MPYLKIPKKVSDRFSLKNVYVSVLVFSVNRKNLNIGCPARFGEIKQETIVIATSGEKTIAHACSGKTSGSSARAISSPEPARVLGQRRPHVWERDWRARAPTGEYVNDKHSNICLKKKNSCRGFHLQKKFLHKQRAKKKNRAS